MKYGIRETAQWVRGLGQAGGHEFRFLETMKKLGVATCTCTYKPSSAGIKDRVTLGASLDRQPV